MLPSEYMSCAIYRILFSHSTRPEEAVQKLISPPCLPNNTHSICKLDGVLERVAPCRSPLARCDFSTLFCIQWNNHLLILARLRCSRKANFPPWSQAEALRRRRGEATACRQAIVPHHLVSCPTSHSVFPRASLLNYNTDSSGSRSTSLAPAGLISRSISFGLSHPLHSSTNLSASDLNLTITPSDK